MPAREASWSARNLSCNCCAIFRLLALKTILPDSVHFIAFDSGVHTPVRCAYDTTHRIWALCPLEVCPKAFVKKLASCVAQKTAPSVTARRGNENVPHGRRMSEARTNGLKGKNCRCGMLRQCWSGEGDLIACSQATQQKSLLQNMQCCTEESLSSIDVFSLVILLQAIFRIHIHNGQVTQCVIAHDKAQNLYQLSSAAACCLLLVLGCNTETAISPPIAPLPLCLTMFFGGRAVPRSHRAELHVVAQHRVVQPISSHVCSVHFAYTREPIHRWRAGHACRGCVPCTSPH